MAGKRDSQKVKRLETRSTERRKLIGQAIIDGILTPADAALIPIGSDPDYNQSAGDYNQSTGGDHAQGGGDYNQSARFINVRDQVINPVIKTVRNPVIPPGE
ncbi:hypothetical protein [Rhodococcus jostii]|uniref:hypothetical protein n=1 Tax=Rhodococcus jostii TaxID=132919 RepID=UPI0036317264